MNLLLLATYAVGQMVTYELERVSERPADLDLVGAISDGKLSLDLYFKETEDNMVDPPFPLLIQKLKGISDLVMEKGDKTYRIVPFESIEISSGDGKKIYGKFREMVNMGNEVVATYISSGNNAGEDIYTRMTIIFSPSDEEDKIEKIYSGWSESCLLRILTPRLRVKQKKKILFVYLEDTGNKEGNGMYTAHWIDGEKFDDDALFKKEMLIFEEPGKEKD
ncbi:hypothetical protein M970_071430 [Encephalitozoon cuniculi EcunIII-L]|uniref:Uncharacterized protein n=1 Tax=Encephalitozoon cuniculi TaxID=6035 RepID=M1JK57_ENCCN|nr:hypothetical protein ECU07_1470 [Encephalitozoon cuniculi]KMV65871.1 hypothetical protein M970_071430 [Encephalitozoon cuniculi EcunIII-L]UYI27310.1 hypothetical protein J0A71_05g11690 [Encephalitozoon cuniculi]